MAGSRKRRIGIGGLDPNPDVKNEVHVSAVANASTISLSYTLHDGRSEKKARTEPPSPPAAVGSEQETKPQPKKRNQVFISTRVLLPTLLIKT